jgi:hypothetical protein
MIKAQVLFEDLKIDENKLKAITEIEPQLVLLFASPEYFENPELLRPIQAALKFATIIGCSTAGEISNTGVSEKTLILTGVHFQQDIRFKAIALPYDVQLGSLEVGENIGKSLAASDLKSVFVLSQGFNINGSPLIEGIVKHVGEKVILTGGLAGDYGSFSKTYTILNGDVGSTKIVALGFYGQALKVGYGSLGGWEPFGPARRVTKAQDNILFELDGQSALDIYKKYLGEKARELPGSGLLYPFALLNNDQSTTGIIRTILGIDEKTGSLNLAGDIQNGGYVRLMHSKVSGLVSGAQGAAKSALSINNSENGLGILISCIGRKLVMGDETEEEVDAVRDIFGKSSMVTGFYSNGEICPFQGVMECKLHNQTMTITYLSE